MMDATDSSSDRQPPPVYTIGYGARSMEAFIGVLQEHGIAYLIDIRSAPYSRYKPEFSKAALERELQRHVIRYVYMGDSLGGQTDNPDDRNARGKIDYERVAQREDYRAGIERVRSAYAQGLRVVLMCSEGKPEMCHRSGLVGKSLAELEIEVVHIDENDELQSQKAVILRRRGGQYELFPLSDTSRKRYPIGGRSQARMTAEDDDDA